MERACARLSRWQGLLPQISFRGRVLILTNLVASSLWHKLAVLTPPESFLRNFQKCLVEFVWSGQHWLRAPVLFLPVQEGGQGLIDLESRVTAFRLHAAQWLLYKAEVRRSETAAALLRKAGGLGLDRYLFLMELEHILMQGLSDFCTSVLKAWREVLLSQ